VKLGEPEALGVLDQHHGGVRHVDPDLDHRGGHQHVDGACLEALHDGILVLAREPTMQESDHKLGKDVALQVGRHVGGGLEIHRFRLLHERIHDVDLSALGHLVGEKLVDLRAPGVGARLRADGLAAGRQLVEHADVEVAVERERERPRDGRRRHHEHVGPLALALEPRALVHAEAVLLVHHGQAQALEGDALLDQRVRADDAPDMAGLHRRAPGGRVAPFQA
jgi:hypothetical protein